MFSVLDMGVEIVCVCVCKDCSGHC